MPHNLNSLPEIAHLEQRITALETELRTMLPTIQRVLERRGFKVHQTSQERKILFPVTRTALTMSEYYHWLKKYSFRIVLRDIIKRKKRIQAEDLIHFCSLQTVRQYLCVLEQLEIVVKDSKNNYSLKNQTIDSFGETLQWFIAEALKREFGALVAWGVKLEKLNHGGDYDVLALFDQDLLFIEVKSAPPKNIHQYLITEFLDRVQGINPDIVLFLVDTHLRLQDKINILFQQEFPRHNYSSRLVSISQNVFQMQPYFYILNSKRDLISNMRLCINHFYRKRKIIIPSP